MGLLSCGWMHNALMTSNFACLLIKYPVLIVYYILCTKELIGQEKVLTVATFMGIWNASQGGIFLGYCQDFLGKDISRYLLEKTSC
jgi:ATP adenylyltransferase/5',5'''-P-1,P-4-tetraphosphate phosphorylase II